MRNFSWWIGLVVIDFYVQVTLVFWLSGRTLLPYEGFRCKAATCNAMKGLIRVVSNWDCSSTLSTSKLQINIGFVCNLCLFLVPFEMAKTLAYRTCGFLRNVDIWLVPQIILFVKFLDQLFCTVIGLWASGRSVVRIVEWLSMGYLEAWRVGLATCSRSESLV